MSPEQFLKEVRLLQSASFIDHLRDQDILTAAQTCRALGNIAALNPHLVGALHLVVRLDNEAA